MVAPINATDLSLIVLMTGMDPIQKGVPTQAQPDVGLENSEVVNLFEDYLQNFSAPEDISTLEPPAPVRPIEKKENLDQEISESLCSFQPLMTQPVSTKESFLDLKVEDSSLQAPESKLAPESRLENFKEALEFEEVDARPLSAHESTSIKTPDTLQEIKGLNIEDILQKFNLKFKSTEIEKSQQSKPSKNQAIEGPISADSKGSDEMEILPAPDRQDLELAFHQGESSAPKMKIESLLNETRPVAKFKDLVDGLFIQEGLKTSLNQEIQWMPQNKEFEFHSEMPVTTMRTHLIDDMTPLLSNVKATEEGGQMTLSLRPGGLGPVKVDIQVEAQVVKVDFHTEHQIAKDFLQSQIGELKHQLNEMGFHVEDVSVSRMSESLENQRFQNDHQQNSQSGRHFQEPNARHRESRQNQDFAENLLNSEERNEAA